MRDPRRRFTQGSLLWAANELLVHSHHGPRSSGRLGSVCTCAGQEHSNSYQDTGSGHVGPELWQLLGAGSKTELSFIWAYNWMGCIFLGAQKVLCVHLETKSTAFAFWCLHLLFDDLTVCFISFCICLCFLSESEVVANIELLYVRDLNLTSFKGGKYKYLFLTTALKIELLCLLGDEPHCFLC